MEQQTTHFGYQQIPVDEKNHRVEEVFNSVSPRYDLMNDLMSLGLHRFWKRYAITRAGLRPNNIILDLAGGTGDLTLQFAKRWPEAQVFLADINRSMLETGRKRLVDAGICKGITYLQVNAEALPFPENYFDCISIGFGLRNITHKDKALQEMARVLKPSGRVLILEFSKLTTPALKPFYDFYSFSVLPRLGKVVCQDADSYRYLAESIRMHPDQETLKSLMETCGFDRVEYQNFHGGIVALHIGFKS